PPAAPGAGAPCGFRRQPAFLAISLNPWWRGLMMETRKLWLIPVALLALSGCAQDDGPLGPGSDIDGRSADLKSTLTCQVSVRSGEVSCGAAEGALGGGASPAVI